MAGTARYHVPQHLGPRAYVSFPTRVDQTRRGVGCDSTTRLATRTVHVSVRVGCRALPRRVADAAQGRDAVPCSGPRLTGAEAALPRVSVRYTPSDNGHITTHITDHATGPCAGVAARRARATHLSVGEETRPVLTLSSPTAGSH